ncbi:MAG: hypothetical protein ACK5XN_00045, partial [Bacteroidota bacterium]
VEKRKGNTDIKLYRNPYTSKAKLPVALNAQKYRHKNRELGRIYSATGLFYRAVPALYSEFTFAFLSL